MFCASKHIYHVCIYIYINSIMFSMIFFVPFGDFHTFSPRFLISSSHFGGRFNVGQTRPPFSPAPPRKDWSTWATPKTIGCWWCALGKQRSAFRLFCKMYWIASIFVHFCHNLQKNVKNCNCQNCWIVLLLASFLFLFEAPKASVGVRLHGLLAWEHRVPLDPKHRRTTTSTSWWNGETMKW